MLGDIPIRYSLELPFSKISSLHALSEHQYLVLASDKEGEEDKEKIFLLRKESNDEPIPTLLNPISQSPISYQNEFITQIDQLSKEGITDFGLKLVMNESIQSPNTLFTTPNSYATLAMGFPELEFSANEVFAWLKDNAPENNDRKATSNPSRPPAYGAKQFIGQAFVHVSNSLNRYTVK